MRHSFSQFALAMLLVAAAGSFSYGQGGVTCTLSGVVVDQSGGVIPGANVVVKNDATGTEFKIVTTESGTVTLPSLDPGTYTAAIVVKGFKQAIVKDIKLVVGTVASIRVTLEVGGSNEKITVQANAEMMQTQSANVSTTLNADQLTELPTTTRNAMDMLVLLPGVNTTSTNRSSTVNGLPNNAVNITIDGINTQDNFLKGSAGGDGFFSLISPRLDSVQEVTISTATPGAESAGDGAVQIKFVTRSGSNQYHGSLYEYHRNPALNSNYWFNNRDKAPTYNGSADPCTPAQLANEFDKCKALRDRVLLNQPGGRVGGPIILPKKIFGRLGFNGTGKAFFFVNYEEYRLPEQQTRTRTILAPMVEQGVLPYTVGTTTRTVDLMALAAANGQTSTFDPTVQKLLSDIRNSTVNGTLKANVNPALQDFIFTNKGVSFRKLLTVRFDFNLTNKHHLDSSYYFHRYDSSPDFLNSLDPSFPGFPNQGSQTSNRFLSSTTLRSTLKPGLVNELRFGLTGGNVLFGADINAGQFANARLGNEDGYALGISAAAGWNINNAYQSMSSSRRSSPSETIADTLSWTKKSHNLSFGGQWENFGMFYWSQQVAPMISFGVDTTYDPAAIMFNSVNGPLNFPNASTTQYSSYAPNTYAVLTGRVTAIVGWGVLNEATNQYIYNGPNVQRGHIREFGLFAQDSWHLNPNLNLTYGIRWEIQFPFTPLNSVYTRVTADDLWGVSGHRNYGNGTLFTPGNMTGNWPTVKGFLMGTGAYHTHYKNFAPSVGLTWSPKVTGLLGKFLGQNGQSVFRGGFSIAYNRNGLYDFSRIFAANYGMSIYATRSMGFGNLITNTGTDVMPVLFRQKSRLGQPSFATTPTYSSQTTYTGQVNLFDPSTRVPYTISWSVGLQRELARDTVLEARYVATRNLQPWDMRNIDELNIVENGFLAEFRNAMANLQANIAAGRGPDFKYYGANTGTTPLPITLAYFSAVPASQAGDPSKYTSSNFTSSTYVNTLAKFNPDPASYANNLWASSAAQVSNALTAGLPANEFVVNPAVGLGGAWFITNGGFNHYDAMQVELRRRFSRGLSVEANYVFAKGLNSSRPSFRTPYVKVLGSTLPDAFKFNFVCELPIGAGRALFAGSHGIIERIIGGWEFLGTGRWQSGNLLNFGNVRLVGMTPDDLRKTVGLRFDNANKLAYYEPEDLRTNTIAAYNYSATSPSGFSDAFGAPTGRYVAPPNTTGCIQVVAGDCAPLTLFVRGPRFQRFDLSLVKKVRLTETKNFELRGEFLNAFNNINFYGTTCASGSASCGQVTSAYIDNWNTQDPGGRLVQLALRINF